MSRAAHFRVSSLYFLIGLNVVVLIILVGVTVYVSDLGNRIEVSQAEQRKACELADESTRLNTITIAKMATIIADYSTNPEIRAEFLQLVPELTRRAGLKPCLALYPK